MEDDAYKELHRKATMVANTLGTHLRACVGNYTPYKMWGENTYPFPGFNAAAVEALNKDK